MYARFTSRVPLRTSRSRVVDISTINDPSLWDRAQQESKEALAKLRTDAPENWPQSRMLALLMIHRSDNAMKIIAHLSGKKLYPRQHDFAALRNNGYATKQLADRFHKLTPSGRRAAKQVADIMGRELGLHLPTFEFDSYSEHRARCCCGWSASVNRRANARAAERLGREFQAHRADPDAWKNRVLKVQEIIDKVGTGTLALFRKSEDAS